MSVLDWQRRKFKKVIKMSFWELRLVKLKHQCIHQTIWMKKKIPEFTVNGGHLGRIALFLLESRYCDIGCIIPKTKNVKECIDCCETTHSWESHVMLSFQCKKQPPVKVTRTILFVHTLVCNLVQWLSSWSLSELSVAFNTVDPLVPHSISLLTLIT